jgi:hypothetical protein
METGAAAEVAVHPIPSWRPTLMKSTLRFLVVPLIALVAVACGNPQQVKSDAGSSGAGVSAAAAASTTTTTSTTLPASTKTTALADLDVVAGSPPVSSGTIKINGAVTDDTIYGWACTQPTLNYDLNRAYTTLTATAGVDDNSIATDQVTMTFTADGANIGTSVVKLGTTAPVQLNVSNVLRLSVAITTTGAACDSGTGAGTHFALGNAQLTPKG